MWHHSGIGTYLRNVVPEVSRHFSTRLLVPEPLPGVAGEQVVCEAPIYSVREQWEVPLRARHARIYWTPHYNTALLPVRAARRLVTIHDVFHLAYGHRLSLPRRTYARLMINHAVRRADRVVTVSDFSRAELVHHTGIDAGRVAVVHNGVDLSHFTPHPTAPEPALPALPARYLLFVGNVKPHKNVLGLLAAFRLLLADPALSDLHLVVVGQRDALRTGVADLPAHVAHLGLQERVLLLGRLPDNALPGLYRRAAALAFPSFYEGFGLPPLEAMACGCPVVVSRAASMPEICGAAARYADPHRPDDLAAGLRAVLLDPAHRRTLVAAGLRQVQHYDWQRAARGHVALLRAMTAGG